MTVAEVRTFKLKCDHHSGCKETITVTVSGEDVDEVDACNEAEKHGWTSSYSTYYGWRDEVGQYWRTECGGKHDDA